MNIEIHQPELAQRVREQIQSGQYHDVDELLTKALDALEEKSSVPAAPAPAEAKKPLAARIREIWADIPDDVRAQLPTDGASQHDHYIYGVPKRTP